MELEFFSNTNHKLSDNSSRVTVTGSSYYQNVFGNVLINSLSNESHCWQFKILKNKESYGIDIGIIDSKHIISEPSFTSNGYGYGLCSNGNIYSANSTKKNNNYKLKNCKQKYKENDLILLTLDLNTKTLSFLIDNNKEVHNKKIIIKNIKTNENITYKMAVYLSYKKDSIQLLNHIKTISNPKIIPHKSENNYKQIIYKLKNIIKEKDIKLIETENKLKELQMKLNELQKEKETEKEREKENEKQEEFEKEIQKQKEQENEKNKLKNQIIKSDDSWRIDLNANNENKDKKRRRSVMELEQNKAVSRRLSRSQQKLIQR